MSGQVSVTGVKGVLGQLSFFLCCCFLLLVVVAAVNKERQSACMYGVLWCCRA